MRVATRFLVAALALFVAGFACAAPKKTSVRKASVAKTPVASDSRALNPHRRSPFVGAIAADVKTGKILFAKNEDAEAYPASVTKLMTLLLVLEDVKAGKYALTNKVVATPDVYRSEPSWVGIKAGETMTVRDLCYALMVESANDAAIALGVHASGSLAGFVARMNARAQDLGMTRTQYYNPNGLPPKPKYPWKKFNVTTASDQLKLALAILKTPEALAFTSVKTCDLIQTPGGYRVYVTRRVGAPDRKSQLAADEKVIKQFCNHNNVMVKDKLKIINPDGSEAVDGLKTGYIAAGGSSIAITAKRGDRRVVAIVLGSASASERDSETSHILTDALEAVAW